MDIVFFSGSDFTIPILDSILVNQGQTLQQVATTQFQSLELDGESIFKTKVAKLLEMTGGYSFANSPISLQDVVTTPDYTLRGKLMQNKITRLAHHHNLSLFQPDKINSQWQDWSRDHLTGSQIALVASFGKILNTNVLSSFGYGCVNWHPSKLPKYRGMSPMQYSLLNGDNSTALSWIEMTAEMDAGDLLLQIDHSLNGLETLPQLTTQMVDLGANSWAIALLSQAYRCHTKDYQFQISQDPDKVSFTGKITKDLGLINPAINTAEAILNHYRAYYGWPKTTILSDLFAQKVTLIHCLGVTQEIDMERLVYQDNLWAQVIKNKQFKTYLRAGLGGYIEVGKIRLESGKEIDFAGYDFSLRHAHSE